ncbi:acyl-CoA dehydratase activase [SCandidatus Aminicenantes bacterium Aminicenantia_JdfR_composite]|jgi:predicted CoA-substrate-specific enzyme activase|nr:acyl-CoA dehydratase activase [SCandidatus Aminicenantes bacterium Aminicenantia_JdfR_composite]MCP2596293.1 acyl-CoA dehydratase activase [Candidatus Aminicenantes bacterium AC-335-G13]MCP2597868.1 acyl-CoA dehydratase activase [Candidatus Aminicenantes bacterium AC-335-L06]MCP2620475.1 acyl-CoA dehydratase activase [Candidatus Aminicenantes bacterium AC-334-E05]
MVRNEIRLGIDIGSVSIGIALIKNNKLIKTFYKFHHGEIKKSLIELLRNLNIPKAKVGFTGRGTGIFQDFESINDIISTIEGIKFIIKDNPKYIMMIGGESFILIELDENGVYKSHEINTDCASGTGIFLEQQAMRLGISVQQLAEMAEKYRGISPSIATRCAVFAKSDLIHRQQEGFSVESISAGLCDGIAQSIVDTIVKGKKIDSTIHIVGGVALNKRVISALRKLLNCEINVVPNAELIPAIGAGILAEKSLDIDELCSEISLSSNNKNIVLNPPLTLNLSQYPDFDKDIKWKKGDVEVTIYDPLQAGMLYDVYLGLDIGSTSTKLVITQNEKVLLGLYTYTKSAPVQATQKLFKVITEIEEKYNIKFNWIGVGTTGSGRQIIGELIKADLIINEISAHAKAAVQLDPDVDTIIEIGGQDSKFIKLQNGSVVQAIMNYICAAGTGSFIEEQAKKLNVPLNEYAGKAMGKRGPVISDRCTVYMERDLSRLLSEGWSKEELLASVLHSVRDNYLIRVVGQAKIGDNICFQGATAKNRALVAAFEVTLKKPIKVSRFCHLAGAYGVCLLLKERNVKKTNFIGLSFAFQQFHQKTKICNICRNKCKITLVEVGNSKVAWGFMCGRDYEDRKYKERNLPFDSIYKIYRKVYQEKILERKRNWKVKKIGLPNALPMIEYIPLWREFFEKIGYKVVISPYERRMIKRGKNIAQTEFCAPILIAHGHIEWLIRNNVDYIFFPIMLHGDREEPDNNHNFFCYYTAYAPVIIKNSILLDNKEKLISPVINFQLEVDKIIDNLYESLKCLSITRDSVKKAFKESLKNYFHSRRNLEIIGEKVLKELEREDSFAIVILGRPYNILDPSINQNIPDLIQQYGYRVLTQDMIKTETSDYNYVNEFLEKVHWYYGKKILKVTEFVAKHPKLFPVYITNFRCSPDSFIITYFKSIMERYGKPYLILQLDELSSDVGYQTRIEAALDSFKNWKPKQPVKGDTFSFVSLKKDKIWILPHIDDIATTLASAVFKKFGYDAIVAEETPESIVNGLKLVGGGECIPTAALIGSFIYTIEKNNLKPERTGVIIPTSFIPCNFPQIPLMIDLGFKRAGFGDLEIFTTAVANQSEPLLINLNLMKIYIIAGLIQQMVARIRPYEINKGVTEEAKNYVLEKLRKDIIFGNDLSDSFKEAVSIFKSIKIDKFKDDRPIFLIIGDLYVVGNRTFNYDLEKTIEDEGGEVLPSTFIDIYHFSNLNKIELCTKHRAFISLIETKALNAFVRYYDIKFRKIASPVLGGIHPLFDMKLLKRLRDIGIPPELTGETAINMLKIIYYINYFQPDAIVHINPLYCCPGSVTSAICNWVNKNFDIPVINLFYDGINNPNKNLKPHLHYLKQKKLINKKDSYFYLKIK